MVNMWGGCFNRAQTCVTVTVLLCVCVCSLHASKGLPTSRTVSQHPEGAPKSSEVAAAPHVMDCYLCGREFDTRVLNKHEDECIKHWRKWNNSLPVDQRQPEPERPEFKFKKATGNMDYNATMEAIWQQHLQSLVPCSLGCGRTFNPDRVAVHERGCKGPKK